MTLLIVDDEPKIRELIRKYQVEAALPAITVTTAAERDRVEDAMTWGKILAGEE